MIKSKHFSKLLSVMLTVAMILGIFCMATVSSSAASYPSVNIDITRISQRPNTGDCAIASIATVEATMYGMPSGDHTSAAYKAVYSANGNSISANWNGLGYRKENSIDLKAMYNQLRSGYPVIVHRSSQHYSVVYAYNGNTSSLELSGFMIIDVDDSYNGSPNARKSLDRWRGSYSLDQTVYRCDGLAITNRKLTITPNHPWSTHQKGSTFSVKGKIASSSKITNVSVSIKDSAGNIAQGSSYTASPNSYSFSISSCDSKMNFSKLGSGTYTYNIWAKDSSGATDSYSYKFTVPGAPNQAPPVGGNTPLNNVAYTAKVTADPSLNLRNGAGTGYDALTQIPFGTIVSVSAESNGWGKISYNGKTGWASLAYLKKCSFNSMYGIVSSSVYMKSDADSGSSNVTKLAKNAIVKISDLKNSYYKVECNGKTGWLPSSYALAGICDVDGNGSVNSADSLSVLKYSVGSGKLDDSQIKLADANGDGKINSADALIILQISIGK